MDIKIFDAEIKTKIMEKCPKCTPIFSQKHDIKPELLDTVLLNLKNALLDLSEEFPDIYEQLTKKKGYDSHFIQKFPNLKYLLENVENVLLENRNSPGQCDQSDIVAVFLLGGRATRFRPFSDVNPKALLPFKGITVPEFLIEFFKDFGIKSFIFCNRYLSEKVEEYYGDGSRFGVTITHVREDIPLGSAGALRNVLNLLSPTFIVTNGDELKYFDLKKMLDAHKMKKALITVGLTTVEDPRAYGVAVVDSLKEGVCKIKGFEEKPEVPPSNFIHAGCSVWQKSALASVPEDEFVMFEMSIFPEVAKNGSMFGYDLGFGMKELLWHDTGNFERYIDALENFKGMKFYRDQIF